MGPVVSTIFALYKKIPLLSSPKKQAAYPILIIYLLTVFSKYGRFISKSPHYFYLGKFTYKPYTIKTSLIPAMLRLLPDLPNIVDGLEST